MTVTPNEHELERLSASVAVHNTVVVPIGNVDPEVGAHATTTGVCPSTADGVVNVTVVPPADVVLVMTAGGHVNVGGSGTVGGGGVGAGGGWGTGLGAVGRLHAPAIVITRSEAISALKAHFRRARPLTV